MEVTDIVYCDFIVKNLIVKNINSLIFGGKARSLPLRELAHVASLRWVPALPVNIGLRQKWLTVTTALVYRAAD
jgi:hypothetical protein